MNLEDLLKKHNKFNGWLMFEKKMKFTVVKKKTIFFSSSSYKYDDDDDVRAIIVSVINLRLVGIL